MSDDAPALLDDGTEPATPEELLARLEELGIEATTHRHPPVFTVEEAQEHKGDLPGAHTKNLFLRDKKGVMWLVVALRGQEIWNAHPLDNAMTTAVTGEDMVRFLRALDHPPVWVELA